MVKSKWFQIAYRAVYLILMALGIADSLGAFSGVLNRSFYVYYTNQSNIICFIIAAIELVVAIVALYKGNKRGENESPVAVIKYLAAVWILITFAVNNILLADLSSVSYWTSFSNVILHFVGPLLFIFDFFLFTKRKAVKWHDIAYIISYPYLYVIFALVRGALIDPANTDVIYPYFFLDPSENGYAYVFMYVMILTVVFVVIAWIFAIINRVGKNREPRF